MHYRVRFDGKASVTTITWVAFLFLYTLFTSGCGEPDSAATESAELDVIGQEKLDGYFVGGAEYRRESSAFLAGFYSQPEAGEIIHIGLLEVEFAYSIPVEPGQFRIE